MSDKPSMDDFVAKPLDMDDPELGFRLIKVHEGLTEAMERVGWALIGTCTPDGFPFIYTIGLHRKGLPELLFAGFDPRQVYAIINMIAEKQVQLGRPFAVGELVDLGGEHATKIYAPPADVKERFTIRCESMLDTADYEVLCIVPPDTAGKFPEEPSCHPLMVSKYQRLMGGAAAK